MRSVLVASKAGGSSEPQSGTAAPATTGSEWVVLSLAAVWKLLSWRSRAAQRALLIEQNECITLKPVFPSARSLHLLPTLSL